MKIEDVKNICVVGAGNMGHQISLQCALYGYKTKCTDVVPAMLEKAEQFVNGYLPGRVDKGKMTKEEAIAARAGISFTSDLKEARKNADIVIEAATFLKTCLARIGKTGMPRLPRIVCPEPRSDPPTLEEEMQ